MTVIDAGVVVEALIDDTEVGRAARGVLSERCSAPQLVDLEVGAALRRLVLAGRLSARRAGSAVQDLHDLPMARVSHRPLLERCWQLRGSVTFYDAAYVALAELLAVPLVTTDARLASAPGPRCDVIVLPDLGPSCSPCSPSLQSAGRSPATASRRGSTRRRSPSRSPY